MDGVDISPDMVAQLRKPGGDRISVTIGDFADVQSRHAPPDLRRLQHAVQSADPGRPGALLQNVAAHLTDDGSFVIEAGSPPSSTGCVTTSTSMRSPSRSTRYGSMYFATIRRSRCSTSRVNL